MALLCCLIVIGHLIVTALALLFLSHVFPVILFSLLSYTAFFTLWIIISSATFQFSKGLFLSDKVSAVNKAVIVTGCDSGFGHLLAKRLDSKGFHVFAACLFPAGDGAADLLKNCSQRLKIVPLDVTDNNSVEEALNFVKNNLGSSELWAVVNNAGILTGLMVDATPLLQFQRSLDVNCMGPIRVTKAFIPLLKISKGRIVNVVSVAGYSAAPFMSPYVISKFGTAGFTECLRHELQNWGISVVAIAPDMFATNINTKEAKESNLQQVFSSQDGDAATTYSENYFKSLKRMMQLYCQPSTNLDLVIDDMERAVTLIYPDTRYTQFRDFSSRLGFSVFEKIPFSWQAFISKIFCKITLPEPTAS